jgi:hypothetical protein
MANLSSPTANNKIGFHYYQDTLHYSNQDLAVWLPELQRLSASWVVLLSDSTRAIPEQFISGLVDANITPIIHFKPQLPDSPLATDLKPILTAYQRWGVKYVVFFDKPNDVSSWSAAGWSHQDLVERFLDRFLPLAQEAARVGLIPVFPPLMPGGSYWDTSFFKSALQSMQRRGQQSLMDMMAVGAYAYTFGHELSWGEGGPEKWPLSKPYFAPADSQDERGFNHFAWLGSIASSFGMSQVTFLQFGAGIKQPGSYYSPEVQAEIVQAMLNKIEKSETETETDFIAACNFWLLTAAPDAEEYPQAWIKPDNDVLPVVRVLAAQTKSHRMAAAPIHTDIDDEPFSNKYEKTDPIKPSSATTVSQPIEHYLLLPVYEWGIADWHLDVTRPFILKYKPTVGFSIQEAALAKKVTVIGGEKAFSEEEINQLRASGCVVDQISGDGTSIATQLLER